MSRDLTHLPDYINEQASEWLVLMQSGEMTAEDQLRFNVWLSEHQDHRQAYQQLRATWQGLGKLSATAEGRALKHSVSDKPFWMQPGKGLSAIISRLREQLAFRRSLGYLSVALVSIIAVGLLFIQQPDSSAVNFYATQTGEIQKITLADGSLITLGAKSKIRARIGKADRHVELIQGEAFFDIAKDASKPFFVAADEVLIEVVGTQFNVLKRHASINVSVLEGIVNVSEQNNQVSASQPNSDVLLTAGQQVIKQQNAHFEQVADVDVEELGLWRSGRLVFNETSLIDVIDDASRYFDGNFSMQLDQLANEKVTLSLRTDQIDQLPHMLAQTLPVKFREIPGNIIVIEDSVSSD